MSRGRELSKIFPGHKKKCFDGQRDATPLVRPRGSYPNREDQWTCKRSPDLGLITLPWGVACIDPRSTGSRIFKEDIT